MADEESKHFHELTVEDLPELLKHDASVKVAGVDVDGVLRGKLMVCHEQGPCKNMY